MSWQEFAGRTFLLILGVVLLNGCSLWESYLHPDYRSSRAERICHPYGDCSQGNWVAADGVGMDSKEAKLECIQEVDERQGNGWWKDSVSRGLQIGACMEKKGYSLTQ
ncbi:MAG: hypothetical protein V3U07_05825 [Nitrospirales bacterium]